MKPNPLIRTQILQQAAEVMQMKHFALYCLDRGVNLKALQEAMGHVQIETTSGYCHADALSVASPLDTLPVNVVPFVQAA